MISEMSRRDLILDSQLQEFLHHFLYPLYLKGKTMESHWLNLGNYHWHYGTAGDSQRFPLVFFHGFLGNYQEFAPAITALSQQFYCLAVDLPGHGQTTVKGDDRCYTLENTALGLIHWLDFLEINTCGLVGYSMGGRLGLYLTLHFPEWFVISILESTSPGLKTEQEREQRRAQDAQWIHRLQQEPLNTVLQAWYAQPLFATLRHHPQFPQLFAQRLQNDPQGLARSLQYLGTGQQPSLWPALPQLTRPLYLITGEADRKFVQIHQQMAAYSPLIQTAVLPHCGHNSHWEQPTAFIAKIRPWLTAL